METPLNKFQSETLSLIAASIADVKLGKQDPIDAAHHATQAIVLRVRFLLSLKSRSQSQRIAGGKGSMASDPMLERRDQFEPGLKDKFEGRATRQAVRGIRSRARIQVPVAFSR